MHSPFNLMFSHQIGDCSINISLKNIVKKRSWLDFMLENLELFSHCYSIAKDPRRYCSQVHIGLSITEERFHLLLIAWKLCSIWFFVPSMWLLMRSSEGTFFCRQINTINSTRPKVVQPKHIRCIERVSKEQKEKRIKHQKTLDKTTKATTPWAVLRQSIKSKTKR